MKLLIGKTERKSEFTLPLELVTQTVAILAKRGVGKTYTATVIAEEMLSQNQQVCVVDPTGAWWGLKSSADGNKDGYKIVVFGGDKADLPLQEFSAEVIAQALVEKRFSAVLDLSHFRKGQANRFMAEFLETLYRLNREPMHLFVDEADAYAPQRTFADDARVLGAMEDIVRRGRKRGIGCTLITQRPAVLNKNVLTQCEVLVALRLVHPKDISAIKEWIEVHAEETEADAMIKSLPSLPVGHAWFWSPGWGDFFERVKVRERKTFDSSATPKPGQKLKSPKALAVIDVEKLGAEIAATAKKIKEENPKALLAKIAELEKQLGFKPNDEANRRWIIKVGELEKQLSLKSKSMDVNQINKAKKQWVIEYQKKVDIFLRQLLTEVNNNRQEFIQKLSVLSDNFKNSLSESSFKSVVESKQTPSQATLIKQPSNPPKIGHTDLRNGSSEITGGMRRIMIALAQRPKLTAKQLGVRAGLSSSSGTFGTYLAKLRSNGWINGDRNALSLTDDGNKALGHYEPLPTGHDLLQYWLSELGSAGAARMLKALADAYPNSLTKFQLGEQAGISPSSGTFGTYLSKLRTLELVKGSKELQISEELV